MDDFRSMARDPKHRRRFEKLLHRAAQRGDADLVEERLSWGIDPPESDRALHWAGPKSWRLWVANRLGAAMAIAKSTSNTVEPCQFAILRARRHGIDVETWTPSASLWSAA